MHTSAYSKEAPEAHCVSYGWSRAESPQWVEPSVSQLPSGSLMCAVGWEPVSLFPPDARQQQETRHHPARSLSLFTSKPFSGRDFKVALSLSTRVEKYLDLHKTAFVSQHRRLQAEGCWVPGVCVSKPQFSGLWNGTVESLSELVRLIQRCQAPVPPSNSTRTKVTEGRHSIDTAVEK